jgi:hypothetical protein
MCSWRGFGAPAIYGDLKIKMKNEERRPSMIRTFIERSVGGLYISAMHHV